MQAYQESGRQEIRDDFEQAHVEREKMMASIDSMTEELQRLRRGLQGN